ncbi:Zinc finger BED domain-containing protein 1 [Phytophthora citrophthora]|uniref:Zinc finger BED domain-containing protein 1 n=1 Tax=Phytophthora citrophthora TaxID=4793 RepID=A0AAD9H0Z8_9STRA|nr:Zinc finger BED domain-containing protein 1 [Phytophthora citrophthora]
MMADSSDQPVKKMRVKNDETRQEPAPAPDLEHPPAAVAALTHTTVRDDPSPPTDVTVLNDKSDLDGYVARAIFGAGLPVATVEHSAFIKMLKRMNPAYDPPSALSLGTSVLDLEYSEVQLKLRAEVLDATAVGLGVESWMAPQKRLLVSCVVSKPSPAVFGFESTGEMPHTVEVLVDRIENIMTQIGTGKVSVIVTDASDGMKQASLSLQQKYPAITFLPSCAHIMNSMMKEILDMSIIANMIDTCKKLVSFFVQDPAARCAIARVSGQTQETAMPMGDPNDASPIGLLQCLFAIERNRHSLDILLAENGALNNLNSKVRDEINSLSFWDEISMFTGLFEPFFEIMKMFESDSPLLSTFYHRFTLLWAHLDKYGSLASKFQHIISKYWQSIQHPAMYTAYLLDPRFPPSGLSGEATSEALAYIKRTTSAEVYGSIVDELTRFTARSGLFADDAIWESAQKCSPIHWWKGFIGSSCPNLQPVALRTLGFPASSGLSRSKREMFDKIQVMNSKYMNEEQAGKAAIVYLNSNLASSVEDSVVTTETLV